MRRQTLLSQLLPQQQALPHSEEAERAVLGAVLLDEAVLGLLRLEPEEFYSERHQLLMRAFKALQAERTPIDLRTVQAKLELRGELDSIGGLAYLSSLDLDLPDIGRVEAYAGIVRERAVRRRLINLSGSVIRDCLNGDVDERELPKRISGWRQDLLESLRSAVKHGARRVGAALDELFTNIENPVHREALVGIPTSFAALDALGPFFLPGGQYVLAGRPGMGKTSLALDLGRHLAIGLRVPVTIFSMEMAEMEIAIKLVSAEAGVSTARLRKGWLSSAEWSRLVQAARRIDEAPLYVDDRPMRDMADVEGRAHLAKSEHGSRVLIYDYVQLMSSGARWMKRTEEVGFISKTLKNRVARELGVSTLVLSQINRDNSRRSDPRPQLSDLAESGALEQDADAVVFVHRHELYEPTDENRGLAELLIRKHRFGELGTVALAFTGETTTFSPLQSQQEGADPF